MSERKEKIKSIAIVFLSIMLVLTFFSNTIMNYSLVEVSTQGVYGGSITTKVRGSGTVAAEEGYLVTIKESRKIKTVNVKTGSEVEEGDVLFVLDESDSTELEAAKDALKAAEDAYEVAVLTSDISLQERLEIEAGRMATLTARQSLLIGAQEDAEAAKENVEAIQKKIENLDTSVDTTAEQLAVLEAERALAKAQKEGTQDDIDSAQNRLEEAQYNLQKKQISGADETIANNLQKELETAEIKLYHAEKYLSEVENLFAQQISLSALYDKVCEARKEVEELSGKTTASEIKAPMAGTITEINCWAGQTVKPDDVIMEIKPESEAFTMQFTVSQTQSKRIKVGDPAEILYNWGSDDITARVKSIQRDPMNRESYVVTCELSGDVNVGDYYTVSIGQQSADYDYVVPTSCIREDSNGKFVLIIEAKSTPLGNRYYARRVNVEIITSDDSQSAITGAFDGFVYVITTTSKPIEENQQVRLAE